ncbi:hypothetical protein AM571_CH01761 [Rhizobium etli 8C-3]|uniref:Uncharacterized protein n=1 Tax=Rhizobium etli 8C-3 TaxID=538025 RepID=A0A1L5P339_RHIET|nr:hypothetical protein [Rhizobium etli]APO74582.1 hypothetical protein AM571_CH01761 [Rhizobium etli 8C-3]
MEINSSAVTKSLVDTKPGELIVFRMGEFRGYCIVLGHEPPYTVLGALDIATQENSRPFHFRRNNTSRCVSYGLDWFVNPSPSAEFWAGNQQHRFTAGCLHLEGNRWMVCFDSSDREYTELHFDLLNLDICASPANEAAPVLNWAIWESRDEFEREADPLVTVTAAQG